jgi:streptogramin lyase
VTLGFLGLLLLAGLGCPARAEWVIEYRTDNTETFFLTVDGTAWFTGKEGVRSLIGQIDPSRNLVKRFYLTGDAELGELVLGPEFLSSGSTSSSFVWFVEKKTGKIGRLDPQTGEIVEWQTLDTNSKPTGLAIHRYGSVFNNTLFFTEYDGNRIGSLRYDGGSAKWILKEFTIPTGSSKPADIAVDGQGLIWFSESEANKIGRFNPWTAEFSEYPVEPRNKPLGVAVDKYNFVWYTIPDANKIVRLDPRSGLCDTYDAPTDRCKPTYIEADAQGNVWFTEFESSRIGKLLLNSTQFLEYSLPDNYAGPYHISISKSTGDVWVTETRKNGVVRILPEITSTWSTATLISAVQTTTSTITSPVTISTGTLTVSAKPLITTVTTITATVTFVTAASFTLTVTQPASTVTTTQTASTVTLITTSTVTTTTSPSRACIIAQAAYGSDLAPDVQLLRTCRDQRLLSTFAGSQFMQIFNRFYYSFSPQVAEVVASNPLLADMTRILLGPLIQILKITMLLPRTEIEITACGLLAAALIGATYLTPPVVILRAFAKRSEDAKK